MKIINVDIKLLPLFLFPFFFAFSPLLVAAENGWIQIGPIVGYERTHKVAPVARWRSRLFYGLRAIAGAPLLSAEAEVTQSKDDESFPSLGTTISETTNTGKLGLRSSFYSGGFGSVYLRAGGQAREQETTTVTNGVTTVEKPAIKIRPYAGAGVSLRIAQNLTGSLSVVAVFDQPVSGTHEYQTSGGFGIHF